MNGGLLHAVECRSTSQLSDAGSGYRFYGLDKVADLLSRAHDIFQTHGDLESQEQILDKEYAELVPDDSCLVERFKKRLEGSPSEFAPL
jgi:hypothetical protein